MAVQQIGSERVSSKGQTSDTTGETVDSSESLSTRVAGTRADTTTNSAAAALDITFTIRFNSPNPVLPDGETEPEGWGTC